MTKPLSKLLRSHILFSLVFATALLGVTVLSEVRASPYGDGRAETGARLFRAMVAADTELEKKVDSDGALRILIIYSSDTDRATGIGELVAKRDAQKVPEPIKSLPVRIELLRASEASAIKKVVGALFLAEPLRREQFDATVKLGSERHIIVYSPFEGDVERGATGGLSIEAQVRPFVNTSALRASQITLREFFLKVAKVFP